MSDSKKANETDWGPGMAALRGRGGSA